VKSRLLVALALGVGAAPTARAQPPVAAGIVVLRFDSAAAARLPHRGGIVAGRRWRDAAGEHTLLLTQTGKLPSRVRAADLAVEGEPAYDAEVYGYHYTYARGAQDSARLLWRTVDAERGCQFDLYAGHLAEAVSLTDLDEDGLAETTFLYTMSCRSDVSPATRKLIMHEGRAKYAIRGTTKPRGQSGGGEMAVDAAFAQAPPALREYAVRQWKRYVAVDTFEQF
jgi:hypothetical protein